MTLVHKSRVVDPHHFSADPIRHPGSKDHIRLVLFLYRTVKTTGVFRTLNFELYAKPNKFVMVFGVLAISG